MNLEVMRELVKQLGRNNILQRENAELRKEIEKLKFQINRSKAIDEYVNGSADDFDSLPSSFSYVVYGVPGFEDGELVEVKL